MVGVIDGFRWCILGGESPIYWPGFFLSLFVVAFFSLAWDQQVPENGTDFRGFDLNDR